MVLKHSRDGEVCPACGEGHLTSQVDYEEVSYAGFRQSVPLYFSTCDSCGSELIDKVESTLNNRAINAFRKTVDRFLTGSEIRSFRKEFGLTQQEAAGLFGGGKIAFTRYENDEITQSVSMDSLMRICIKNPCNLELLAEIRNVSLPQTCIEKIESHYLESSIKIAARAKQKLDRDMAEKYSRQSSYSPKEDLIPTATWDSNSMATLGTSEGVYKEQVACCG